MYSTPSKSVSRNLQNGLIVVDQEPIRADGSIQIEINLPESDASLVLALLYPRETDQADTNNVRDFADFVTTITASPSPVAFRANREVCSQLPTGAPPKASCAKEGTARHQVSSAQVGSIPAPASPITSQSQRTFWCVRTLAYALRARFRRTPTPWMRASTKLLMDPFLLNQQEKLPL